MARFKLEDRVRLKSTGVEYSISATISVFEGGNINLVYELTEGEKDAWGAYINTGERYRAVSYTHLTLPTIYSV